MADIAYLGLGIMGSGMVRNLLKAGHDVTAWNRTRRQLHDDLSGAALAADIAGAVKGRQIVMLCLTGPDAQKDVFFGKAGGEGGDGEGDSSGVVVGTATATLAGDFSPNFYLKHMLKDARLIGGHARKLGISAPSASLIAEMYQAAFNAGLGDLNASALHQLNFTLSGLDIPKSK